MVHKRKSQKARRVYKLIIIVLILIVFVGGAIGAANIFLWKWESIEAIATVVSVIAAACGLILESRNNRELQEADFIMELNMSYTNNDDFKTIYTFLEDEYYSSIGKEYPNEDIVVNSISRNQISNYLTFFECISLLISKGTISFEQIDDLFGYRFFLAVHSETFQDQKLLNQPLNFKNIYRLEKEWSDYRKKKGKNIFREDMALEKRFNATNSDKKISYSDLIS